MHTNARKAILFFILLLSIEHFLIVTIIHTNIWVSITNARDDLSIFSPADRKICQNSHKFRERKYEPGYNLKIKRLYISLSYH